MMHPIDWLILGFLAAAVIAVLLYLRRHKGGCAGGCGSCPHAGGCAHTQAPPLDEQQDKDTPR